MITLGGVERTREETQEQRSGWLLGTVLQDIRYALRGFRRNPVFTITVDGSFSVILNSLASVGDEGLLLGERPERVGQRGE